MAGAGVDGRGYVIRDLSGRYGAERWANETVRAYRRYHADRISPERNNGGDLVERNIRIVDPRVPLMVLVPPGRAERLRVRGG